MDKMKVHGVPGEWARARGSVVSMWPLFVLVFAAGAFSAGLFAGGKTLAVCAGLLLASAGCFGWCFRNGVKRLASFFVGARGEERVAGVLAGLDAPGSVFNDFSACGTFVDHVVVTPGLVCAIETKNWNGRVTCEEGRILLNGWLPDRSPVDQALRQSRDVARELEKTGWKGTVKSVLCFASNAWTGEEPFEIGGVTVLNLNTLGKWIKSHPPVMADAEYERLAALMETRR